MHIAFVTETWPPQINGVALTVYALAQGMIARGHRVEVVRPGTEAYEHGMEMVPARAIRMPRYPGLHVGLPQALNLYTRWRARGPDVVYIASEGPLGASAMRAARLLGIPVITGFHTRFDDYAAHYGVGWLNPLVRAWLLRFHRRAMVTLVPTRELVEELRSDGVAHVQRLRRGVDAALFDPARRDMSLRASWGAAKDAPVMLCVGRVAAEKNLGLAIQAFRILQARRPSARLVIVGDGPQRPALAAASPDVHFVGARHGVELAAHYASADVFLFPSLTETFGNVVLEAMASGLPLVAFDRAAAQEHVANGISGLVVPGSDSRGFIGSAYALGMDSELRERMGFNARLAAQRCTPEAVIAGFEAVLHSLLQELSLEHACSGAQA